MAEQELLHHVVTRVGLAEARLVDTWLGVAATGDILVRDVWAVTMEADDLTLECRVMTFPEPSVEDLAVAVQMEISKALLPDGS